MSTRWYFGDQVNGWRIWGVWIRQRWFVGVSVTPRQQPGGGAR